MRWPWRRRTDPRAGISLERQLLLWLLLPQLVLWLGGGIGAFHLASAYVSEAIDASLLQAGRALSRQLKPIGSGLFIDLPKAAQDVLEADPSDRLYYMVSSPPGQFILGNQSLPAPTQAWNVDPVMGQAYYFDGEMTPRPAIRAAVAGGPPEAALTTPAQPQAVRVLSLYQRFGEDAGQPQTMLIQIARSSTNREALAKRILIDMLLPMSMVILLLTLIVWLGIRKGLEPLTRLRQQVHGRSSSDLAPLQLESAPRELWSLMHALNALLSATQTQIQAQKRFIGDAAHQLRTPLAGLKTQTELALQATQDPELHARLVRVHSSAVRSTHLIHQLLTLARAEPQAAARQDLQRLDVRALTVQVTAELVPRALRERIDLGVDEASSEEPIWIAANPLLMREAIFNIIDNALRYAGAQAVVTVKVTHDQGSAVIEVQDNGPGIAQADHARVFERFVRGTETGDGCGLGLPIVKEIIEHHAGQVLLQNVQPRGLRVRVELPVSLT